MRKICVLVIDNSLEIIESINNVVDKDSWTLVVTSDGNDITIMINKLMPDLILINATSPVIDGYNICSIIRRLTQIPLIVLSSNGNSRDKVKYLNLGVDEYINLPVETDEIAAQIKTILRRRQLSDNGIDSFSYINGEIEMYFDTRKVLSSKKEIRVTPTEFNLLYQLALNAGKVCTHAYLLENVWGTEFMDEKTYLHTYIKRLRTKLEINPENPQYIITVNAVGYLLIKP